MSLKEAMEGRGINRGIVDRAIENTEKVLATVVMNASKNVTGAQAMKGNASNIAEDLKVLKALQEEFVKADKAVTTKKIVKPTVKEANNVVSDKAEVKG